MSLRLINLLRSIVFCLCCAFLLSLFVSPLASAHTNSDPITVTSESDIVHFPNSIDYFVSATDSAHPITQAILYVTYNGAQNSFPAQHAVTFSHPSFSINTQWSDDTSTDSTFQLPGTPGTYKWVIQDSAGFQHTQAAQTFTTVDTRFSWQHLTNGLLQVNWYGSSAAFGQLLLQDATNALNHIKGNLGGGLLHPINLWVYASDQDFHGALGPSAYEWVGGEAIPWLSEAFISVKSSQDPTLVRDMPHELTHLVFHQLIANGQAVPTWFDEGLAVYNQFYHEPDMKTRFEEALLNHSLLRLSTISLQFPADADQAYLAYAQSWQLLSYMYTTFGVGKMQRLIKNMNNPSMLFDADLQQTLGEDTAHLENQWLLSLNQPGTLSPDQLTPTVSASSSQHGQTTSSTNDTLPVVTVIGVLLIVLPFAGIVIILVVQVRKRRKARSIAAATAMYARPTALDIPASLPAVRSAQPTLPANGQYQYIPFYYPSDGYPTADEPYNPQRVSPNPPPAPPMTPRQNGVPNPAPQSKPLQGQDDMSQTWGPFSEYVDPGKNAPGKQAPQE